MNIGTLVKKSVFNKLHRFVLNFSSIVYDNFQFINVALILRLKKYITRFS